MLVGHPLGDQKNILFFFVSLFVNPEQVFRLLRESTEGGVIISSVLSAGSTLRYYGSSVLSGHNGQEWSDHIEG